MISILESVGISDSDVEISIIEGTIYESKRKTTKALMLLASMFFVIIPATSYANDWPHGGHHHHHQNKDIVGYFTNWGIYGRNFRVKDIVDNGSADKLTVINYAFGNVAPNADGDIVCQLTDPWADYQTTWTAEQSVTGEAVNWDWGSPSPGIILGNFQQLKALKEIYPSIKVLISLGGWTLSQHFSDAALTAESRATLAASCIDLFIAGNLPDPGWGGMGGPASGAGVFDGIDIDWEYPGVQGAGNNAVREEDTENFTTLLAEFRSQMDEVNPNLMLTIAVGASKKVSDKLELNKIHKYLDFINLMTYDFAVGSSPVSNHQSNLFPAKPGPDADFPDGAKFHSVRSTVRTYQRGGVPRNKLVVGVPFYSRGWTGVEAQNNGMFQNATGPAAGVWEAGINDYKVVKDLVVSGFDRNFNHRAQAAWLYDGSSVWTFDDPEVMCRKSLYARIKGLRGMMFWELSGDDEQGALISSLDRCLTGNPWRH